MLNNDKEFIFYKMLFDGADLLDKEIGTLLIPDEMKKMIMSLTRSDIYSDVDKFLDYCPNSDYIGKLSNKYQVKLYKTSWANDDKNPWKNKQYILFNDKELNGLDIEFHVCPSFDENGNISLGFRVINPDKVNNAFKWLFMNGNNILYGRDSVDKNKPCYVVEGFRDYVALKETGYNVIGLGSVYISDIQREYLDTLSEPILLLDNDKFGLKQAMRYYSKYRVATLIGTEEKDAWDTFEKGIPIEIVDIK